jgi:hypothetical protein
VGFAAWGGWLIEVGTAWAAANGFGAQVAGEMIESLVDQPPDRPGPELEEQAVQLGSRGAVRSPGEDLQTARFVAEGIRRLSR